jgi:hypothetical protein
MIEAVKLIGSVLGFITFCWALWDRLLRHWPALEQDRVAGFACLRVRNPSTSPIAVSFAIEPTTFWLREHSENDAEHAACFMYEKSSPARTGSEAGVIVGAGEERRSRIINREWPASEAQEVVMRMIWQPLRRRPIWSPPVQLNTTIGDLGLLKEAKG